MTKLLTDTKGFIKSFKKHKDKVKGKMGCITPGTNDFLHFLGHIIILLLLLVNLAAGCHRDPLL